MTHVILVQHIPVVSKYIMYSSALVPVCTCASWHSPQQEARKPPRMEGTTIFLFIFITTTIKKITHCTILQLNKITNFIPYLIFYLLMIQTFWIVYFDICSVFVHVYHKTFTDRRYNYFLPFLFYYHRQEVAKYQYTIFNQKILKKNNFYICCAGFNFNFTHICPICTTKPADLYHKNKKCGQVQVPRSTLCLWILLPSPFD